MTDAKRERLKLNRAIRRLSSEEYDAPASGPASGSWPEVGLYAAGKARSIGAVFLARQEQVGVNALSLKLLPRLAGYFFALGTCSV